jgi:hypothetical protein
MKPERRDRRAAGTCWILTAAAVWTVAPPRAAARRLGAAGGESVR